MTETKKLTSAFGVIAAHLQKNGATGATAEIVASMHKAWIEGEDHDDSAFVIAAKKFETYPDLFGKRAKPEDGPTKEKPAEPEKGEGARMVAFIVSKSEKIPTAEQIENGLDGNGEDAIDSGTVPIRPGPALGVALPSSPRKGTTYYVHFCFIE